MRKLNKGLNWFAVWALVLGGVGQARAGIIPIPMPDAAYQGATTKIGISVPDGTNINMLSDSTLAISFSELRTAATVPGGGWATWSSPPFSESATPRVLHAVGYDPADTSVKFTFSTPLSTFGLEAEPDPFQVHNITATFFDGAAVVGTISLDVDGNAGARLFAAEATGGDQFTSVTLSSDTDFAFGEVRYAVATVPEPATLTLLGIGIAGMAGYGWRRKKQQAKV